MEMREQFTEQDSLKVINQMISTARGNLRIGAGKYFVLWGYLVFITSVVHALLLFFYKNEAATNAGNIWLITLIIGIPVTIFFAFRDSKKSIVSTYTDRIVSSAWIGFGVSALLIMILLNNTMGIYIYPAITFLYTYALFMSATAYKFKWMYVSVAICLLCVLSYKLVFTEKDFLFCLPLPMAVSILAGNIIPGHILNHKAKKQNV